MIEPEYLFKIIFSAILGGIFGSFANVLILRWHEGASLMGRSNCPQCRRTIRPRHLIPVMSWIWLRGRCADCGTTIHVQYPLVEAACVILAVIAALRHDPLGPQSVRFWFEFFVSLGLVVPVVMDIRWKELPVEYLAGLSIVAYAFRIAMGGSFVLPLVAIAIPVTFFGLQYVLSRGRWIGAGDLWFGAAMGCILGTPLLTGLGLYLAYLLGGVVAVVGLLTRRLKRGDRIPFAPALAAGTLVALWYGERLLSFFVTPS